MNDPATTPMLRTLSPLLHTLSRDLRAWLDTPHLQPLSLIARSELEGMSTDLHRQSQALDVDRPLLIIMLMGGTGVGKSTLLNALAGASVAPASFTRPTTRDPVVYYHETIKTEKLDKLLQHCRLVPHDRPNLIDKILVDTPDLDSNDLANRDKLMAILPVADIVLYVGSQEKYHDQLGWQLFKQQRQRRAFAFILNKWDRCQLNGATGLRPDEDWLRDLKAEGFVNPILFRTVSQAWVEESNGPAHLPEGEQFRELRDWLELGLTRKEIEAIKARGVEQLLDQLEGALERATPPDLTEESQRTQQAWENVLRAEAESNSDTLVHTLDPYAPEVEHHFRTQYQHKFRGLMSMYQRLVTKLRYTGTGLRDHLPLMPKVQKKIETPTDWNLAAFAHELTRVASEKVLNQRYSALVNRLLVEADRQRYPASLLNQATSEASRMDWQSRYDQALIEALSAAERACTEPTGFRRLLQITLIFAANTLPELTFLSAFGVILWRYFVEQNADISLVTLLIPFGLTLAVLVILQLLIAMALPLRWGAVRDIFEKELTEKLNEELRSIYLEIPQKVTENLLRERQQIEQLRLAVQESLTWVTERQTAAQIAGLYGN